MQHVWLAVLLGVCAVACVRAHGPVLARDDGAHAAYARAGPDSNLRPVMGVLTQPAQGIYAKYGASMAGHDHVAFLESAGMRVALVPYDLPTDDLAMLLGKLNGVLFQGGPSDIIARDTPYYRAAQQVYDYALANPTFVLWGTCLGFELICDLGAQSHSMARANFTAENMLLSLAFTPAARTSRMFTSMPADVYRTLADPLTPVTVNLHHNGVAAAAFRADARLSTAFRLLSTNVDRDGREFVSTIEHATASIFAVQWHPERDLFTWFPTEHDNHSTLAVHVVTSFAQFIAAQARRNTNHFDSPSDALQWLYYATPLTYVGDNGDNWFEACYFLPAHAK